VSDQRLDQCMSFVGDRLTYLIVELKERLLGLVIFRLAFLAWSLAKAGSFWVRGNDFESADATLYYSRILTVGRSVGPLPVASVVRRRNTGIVKRCRGVAGENYLLASYVKSREAEATRQEFARLGLEWARAMKYPRADDRPDREGDLLVLKPFVSPRERGVLLVCYNDSLRRFAALYDLRQLAERYVFVLEPSTWGYEDATFLSYSGLPTDVVVESQYRPDYDYIRGIGGNMHPIALGAGDWVDPDAFRCGDSIEKKYDIVMVASWLALKRHALLFSALRSVGDRIGRVALIGYPFNGRTLEDIKAEAATHGVLDMLDIHEQIPFEKVSEILQQSKVSAMLSKREGASRALYESLFANTPVVVSRSNVGINRDHVNGQTGMLSADDELGSTLLWMVENAHLFTPRAWAIKNTGYRRSTERLNKTLKDLAAMRGEDWTVDIFSKRNRHNAVFVNPEERRLAREHLGELGSFLRGSVTGTRGASE